MKKKFIYAGFLAIFAVVSTLFLLTGCVKTADFSPNAPNLASDVVYTNKDGKTSKKFHLTNSNPHITVTFPQEVEINTILLNETTTFGVDSFEIWTKIGEKNTLIYQQDEINGMRYCFLDKIKLTQLTIHAFSRSAKFNVNRFEAYNIARPDKDFRVTTYLQVENFLKNPLPEALKHVTDVILFGVSYYDEAGLLKTDDEKIEKVMQIIKTTCGDKMPRIYSTFMLSSKAPNTQNLAGDKFFSYLQNIALGQNGATLIQNIADFTTKHNFDGVAFDYEFPYTNKDYKIFSQFLVDLKAKMPSKILSIAVATWGLNFSKAALDAVDIFELMAYDDLDDRGNHSGWENTLKGVDYLLKFNIPKHKINLGVPFYSRPVDSGGYWGSYPDEYKKLGKFLNYVSDEFLWGDPNSPYIIRGRYYNGVNMIQDKTAFAYDFELGGMMIWSYVCDLDYNHESSLLRAMNRVLEK